MTVVDLPDAVVTVNEPGRVVYAGGVTVLGDVSVTAPGRSFTIPGMLDEAKAYTAGLLAAIARVEAAQ